MAHTCGRGPKKLCLPEYQGVGVDDETVQEGQQALISYYQEKGYFDIKVTSEMTGDDQAAHGRLSHRQRKEAQRYRRPHHRRSATEGRRPARRIIAVEKKHFLSHGQFSDQLVRTSVKNLKGVYQSQGFSTRAGHIIVMNHGGDIEVAFHVTEGPRDVVSSLAIQGANTFPAIAIRAEGSEGRSGPAVLASERPSRSRRHHGQLLQGRIPDRRASAKLPRKSQRTIRTT